MIELLTEQAEKLGKLCAGVEDLRGDLSAHASTDQISFKEIRKMLGQLQTGYAVAQAAGAKAGAAKGKSAGLLWGAGGTSIVIAVIELAGKIWGH